MLLVLLYLDRTWSAAVLALPYLLGEKLETIIKTEEVCKVCQVHRPISTVYSRMQDKNEHRTSTVNCCATAIVSSVGKF